MLLNESAFAFAQYLKMLFVQSNLNIFLFKKLILIYHDISLPFNVAKHCCEIMKHSLSQIIHR